MKKKYLFGSVVFCVVLILGACGSGSLEWAEDDDFLALEKYESVTENDIILALEACKGDSKCKSKITKQFIENPLNPKDTTDSISSSSSSDYVDLFGLSSSSKKDISDSVFSSSSEITLSSSSVLDSLVSSSSEIVLQSSSSNELLSSSLKLSSSSIVSSSSSKIISSSSLINLSSSQIILLSSSSFEEESSSSVNLCTIELIHAGTCKVNKSTIRLGESAVWTYTPSAECIGGRAEWMFPEADVGKVSAALVAEFKFSDEELVGEKIFPTGTLKIGKVSGAFDCSEATLKILPSLSSSSSLIQISSSSIDVPIPSSSSILILSSSSGIGCRFVGGMKICDGDEISSSSVVTPSSSSIVIVSSSSSEIIIPSSSSEVSSSSEENYTLVSLVYGGAKKELISGNYSIICEGQHGKLLCHSNSNASIIVNGVEFITEAYDKEYGECFSGKPPLTVNVLSTVECWNSW